jgi:hypothetical protein
MAKLCTCIGFSQEPGFAGTGGLIFYLSKRGFAKYRQFRKGKTKGDGLKGKGGGETAFT